MRKVLACCLAALVWTIPVSASAAPVFSGPADAAESQFARYLSAAVAQQLGSGSLRAQVTAGPLASLDGLLGSEAEALAVVRADLARDAWLGSGRFDQPHPDLRALAVLHASYLAVISSPGLHVLGDLRGKRLAIGGPATGDREAVAVLLDAAAIPRAEVTTLPSDDPFALLRRGDADAVFAVAAPGDVSVTQALAQGAHWLGLQRPEPLPESAWPWQSATVASKEFAGLSAPVATLSVAQVLVARQAMPRLVVDQLVESLWSDPPGLARLGPAFAATTRSAAAMPSPLPLHPGAASAYGRAGPLDKATDVRVTLWLLDISDVDVQKDTFAFDATLEYRWLDPRLNPGDRLPFEVMNARDVQVTSNGYAAHGPWHSLNWRLHGTARAHFDLHHYPFDLQRLELTFEHPLLQVGELVLHCETRWHPEASLDLRRHRLGPDFALRDWDVVNVRSEESKVEYGPGEIFSRYAFVVEVHREAVRFLVAELAPIILMVLMALGASLIPAEKLDAKLLLTVLSLLVAVELQVSASERAPEVGYLTLLDWAYFAAYASIAVGVLQTIAEYRLHAANRDAAARRVRNLGATVAALVFVLPVALLMWYHARGH